MGSMNKFFGKLNKYGITEYNYDDLCIKETIGGGGFGEVSRCILKEEERACKRLYFEMDETLDGFLCDLLEELIYSTNLNNKRFMKVYGVSYDKENEELYIIMELLKEGDLKKYLLNKELSLKRKIKLFKSLVIAVKDLHKENYIHADLKLENVCYYEDDNEEYIKLLDYNMMSRIKETEEYVIGWESTCGYSSPEQDNEKLCKKSDVYALGVIFLEIMLSKDIWEGKKENSKIYRKCVIKNLESLNNNEKIYSIIKKCICKCTKDRFSIEELLETLRRM